MATTANTAANTAPSVPVRASQGHKRLSQAVAAWFAVTVAGQLLFSAYIIAFYAPPALRGNFAGWSMHRQVIDGYVAGDTAGNVQFGAHVLMAAILTLGGMLQLWPALRARVPGLHRWNGRVFVVTALLAALGGLWLVWVRGSRLDMASGVSITLNAVLILGFVGLAWRAARDRDFAAHRRWAVRAFLVVSGVWFLRLGIMAFGLIASGLLGLPKTLSLAFFPIWSFGSYLVPLAVHELYLRARASDSVAAPYAMAGGMMVLTLLMMVGIVGAMMVFWVPPLRASGMFG